MDPTKKLSKVLLTEQIIPGEKLKHTNNRRNQTEVMIPGRDRAPGASKFRTLLDFFSFQPESEKMRKGRYG